MLLVAPFTMLSAHSVADIDSLVLASECGFNSQGLSLLMIRNMSYSLTFYATLIIIFQLRSVFNCSDISL